MSEYTGGLRYRLIYDSMYRMLYDAMQDLGHFDPSAARSPINFPPEPVSNDEAIPTNTLALSDEDMDDWEHELGSNKGRISWTMYVDFYAESKPLGIHVINDVRDVLKGRKPDIGREHPVLEVMDWTLATPVEIFYCDLEDVVIDKGLNPADPYRRHWYTCRVNVIDYYG